MEYTIVQSEEEKELYACMKQLDLETKYMLYLPEERQYDGEKMKQMIRSINQDGAIIGAKEAGKIVGYLSLNVSPLAKIKHTAYIVMGITKDFQGQGVGKQLFKRAIALAEEKELHRLELTVIEENQVAVHLYQRMGFVQEGIKQDSIYMDGQYYDEVYMARLL